MQSQKKMRPLTRGLDDLIKQRAELQAQPREDQSSEAPASKASPQLASAPLQLAETPAPEAEAWPPRPLEEHFTFTQAEIQTPSMDVPLNFLKAASTLTCTECDGDGWAVEKRPYLNGFASFAVHCRCRPWVRNANLFNQARLPYIAEQHTLESVDWSLVLSRRWPPGSSTPEPVDLRREILRVSRGICRPNSSRRGLILYGPTGTAKSHLAQALVRKFTLEQGRPTRWVYWPTFAELLHATFGSRGVGPSSAKLLAKLGATDILVIEEIGGDGISRSIRSALESVFNYAEEQGRTVVVTTNYSAKELAGQIGEPSVSRMVGLCEIVEMQGIDYRQII